MRGALFSAGEDMDGGGEQVGGGVSALRFREGDGEVAIGLGWSGGCILVLLVARGECGVVVCGGKVVFVLIVVVCRTDFGIANENSRRRAKVAN